MAQNATKRKCPFCDQVTDSRGLYAHVMNTSDEAHGEQGDVPENFNPREAEIVTENDEVIEARIGEEYQYPNRIMMCHHCGIMSKGRRGLAIHLSKTAGDEFHPESSSIEDGAFTEIPADGNWEPITDHEELSEMQAELTANIHDLKLFEGEEPEPSAAVASDEQIQDMINRLIIPEDQNKTEQVATVLNQIPELYEKPEIVKEILNCSTTSFYEGRKLFDNNFVEEGNGRMPIDTPLASDAEIVNVNGTDYISVEVVENMIKGMNQLSNDAAKIIHRNQ